MLVQDGFLNLIVTRHKLTVQGPELRLDLSGQEKPLLTLEVSTPQGTELHPDRSEQQEPLLFMDVSTVLNGTEPKQNVSI
jgi:hypothetical protein